MTLVDAGIGKGRGPRGPSWTDERVETLRGYAADGMSASQIAAAFGDITRNAVIGKLSRLRVSLNGVPTGQEWRRQPKPAAPRFTKPQPERVKIRPGFNSSRASEIQVIPATEITDIEPGTSAFACTIVDLKRDMCRWPLDETPSAEMLYCGAPSVGSWCARHRGIAFTPMEKRRRR